MNGIDLTEWNEPGKEVDREEKYKDEPGDLEARGDVGGKGARNRQLSGERRKQEVSWESGQTPAVELVSCVC